MKVWMPTGEELPCQVQVNFTPLYTYSGEQPVHVQVFSEGDVSWYGSGSCVVSLGVLPIKVTMPVRLVGGRIRWCVPADRDRPP
jgi:hypothetical protein